MKEKKTATLVCQYELKKRNRRMDITCYRSDDDPHDFVFFIKTKRLIDFKTREILRLNCSYGLESILAMRDVLMQITNEPLFLKLANVAINNCTKDRYKAVKYVNDDFLNNVQNPEPSVATGDASSNTADNQK